MVSIGTKLILSAYLAPFISKDIRDPDGEAVLASAISSKSEGI